MPASPRPAKADYPFPSKGLRTSSVTYPPAGTPLAFTYYFTYPKLMDPAAQDVDPRNETDYDTWVYGTEPIPGDHTWLSGPCPGAKPVAPEEEQLVSAGCFKMSHSGDNLCVCWESAGAKWWIPLSLMCWTSRGFDLLR